MGSSIIILALLTIGFFGSTHAQRAALPHDQEAFLIEVMHFPGKPLAYQNLEKQVWYHLFHRLENVSAVPELNIRAVKISPFVEKGIIKARVSLLLADNLDSDVQIEEVTLSDQKPAEITRLMRFGITPFRLLLVRDRTTAPVLPQVVSKAPSITASAVSIESDKRLFGLKVENISSKPLLGVYFYGTAKDAGTFSSYFFNVSGAILAGPGENAIRVVPIPTSDSTRSSIEVPRPVHGLVVTIASALFADGSSEGDPVPVKTLKEIKSGEKVEIKRLLNILKGQFTSADDVVKAVLGMNNDFDDSTLGSFSRSKRNSINRVRGSFLDELAAAGRDTGSHAFDLVGWISTKRAELSKWQAELP